MLLLFLTSFLPVFGRSRLRPWPRPPRLLGSAFFPFLDVVYTASRLLVFCEPVYGDQQRRYTATFVWAKLGGGG
jgi:hypothetical protein